MSVKEKLLAIKNYPVYCKVNMMEAKTDDYMENVGIATSNIKRIDEEMQRQQITIRITALEMATYYRNGVGFTILDPDTDAIPIYRLMLDFLTEVAIYLNSVGFKHLRNEDKERIGDQLLRDAFVLEALADVLFEMYYTALKEKENKKQFTSIIDTFRNYTATSAAQFKAKDRAVFEDDIVDIDNSPHRLALRSQLDELTINKYMDYAELGI